MEFQNISAELTAIKARNARVEADKAWETSACRIALVAAITYASACALLYMLGASNYYWAALVPVAGFVLSTLSLPAVKDWWIRERFQHGTSRF